MSMAARTVPRRALGIEAGADHDLVFLDALRFGRGQLEIGRPGARGSRPARDSSLQRIH